MFEIGMAVLCLAVGYWACGWRLRRIADDLLDRADRRDREVLVMLRRVDSFMGGAEQAAPRDSSRARPPTPVGRPLTDAEADEQCPGKGSKPPAPLGKTKLDGFDEPGLN